MQCSKNDEAFRSVFFWVSTISSLSVKGLVAIKLKGGKFWLQQSGLKAGLYGWFPAMPKVAFSAQIFGEDDTLDTSRRRDILFPQSFVLKAYHSDHLYKNSCANMYCIYIYIIYKCTICNRFLSWNFFNMLNFTKVGATCSCGTSF